MSPAIDPSRREDGAGEHMPAGHVGCVQRLCSHRCKDLTGGRPEPITVTRTESVPTFCPSVQRADAVPSAATRVEDGVTVPAPASAANPTSAPDAGLSYWSTTRTVSGIASVALIVSTWASPDTWTIFAGASATATALNTTGARS